MALRRAAPQLAQSWGFVAPQVDSLISSLFKAELDTANTDCGNGQVRNASNQAVKLRIRAIKNIGKITKAMKMVAASKMRNAQSSVETSRGIVNPFIRLFGDHPAYESAKSLTVSVTSDRGLCGGLNSNIAKYTRSLLAVFGGDDTQQLAIIGEKGRAQIGRNESRRFALTVADAYKNKVTFAQASLVAEEILKLQPDVVRIVFNKFRSAISFKPTIATVLSAEAAEKQLTDVNGSKLDVYEIEADGEKIYTLQDLAEFQLAATLYNAFLENNCSEHASRMSAMENSTKSAGEMLTNLTLAYNRKRQASITTELIEIIAGASALVDAE